MARTRTIPAPELPVGPQLLGRFYVPDPRDWSVRQLNALLACREAALMGATQPEIRQMAGEQPPNWWFILWQILHNIFVPPPSPPGPTPPPNPPTPPTPPVPSGDIINTNPQQHLNQAQTNHCVGMMAANWGNILPVTDAFTSQDGHNLYYECKVIDRQPRAENGSSVRSGFAALKNRQRLIGYAAASTVDEIIQWLAKGPVGVGTDWSQGMFKPDAQGQVHLTGSVQGGHAWVIKGVYKQDNMFLAENSWSETWNAVLHGDFLIAVSDFARLLASQGDAVCAIEQPV